MKKEAPLVPDAEYLEQPAAPEQFYGTSAPKKEKSAHIGVAVCLCLTAILLSTVHLLVLLLGVRLVKQPDGWRLTVGADQSGKSADTPRPLDRTAADTQDAELETQDEPVILLQSGGTDGQTAAQSCEQERSAVVGLTVQFFDTQQTFTGVIITHNGYVLSSCGELCDAVSIVCSLDSGEQLPASFLGTDERTGLTLLKLNAEGLPVVHFGAAALAQSGDTVFSIGNPAGYLHNVLQEGIVTAIGVDQQSGLCLLTSSLSFDSDCFGCPILDQNGLVIGLTSLLGQSLSGSEAVLGIPAEALQDAVDRILTENLAADRWLGFDLGEIPQYVCAYYGFPGSLWIRDIADDSARCGGLCGFDVLVAADGVQVRTTEEFQQLLAAHLPGEQMQLVIFREGEYYYTTLTVQAR